MSDERQAETRYRVVLEHPVDPERLEDAAKRVARATHTPPERIYALLERGPGTLARTTTEARARSLAQLFRNADIAVAVRPADAPDISPEALSSEDPSSKDSDSEDPANAPEPAPPTPKAAPPKPLAPKPAPPKLLAPKPAPPKPASPKPAPPKPGRPSSKKTSRPQRATAPAATPTATSPAKKTAATTARAARTWRNPLLIALLCLVIGVTGGYLAGSNADALDRFLSDTASRLFGLEPAPPRPSAPVAATGREKRDYIDSAIRIGDLGARYDASLRLEPVAVVTATVTNSGSRAVALLFVTAYFLDADAQVVAEESYPAVLSSSYTTSREGPLMPGETRAFSFTADDVPERWQEGEVRAEVVDIDFE